MKNDGHDVMSVVDDLLDLIQTARDSRLMPRVLPVVRKRSPKMLRPDELLDVPSGRLDRLLLTTGRWKRERRRSVAQIVKKREREAREQRAREEEEDRLREEKRARRAAREERRAREEQAAREAEAAAQAKAAERRERRRLREEEAAAKAKRRRSRVEEPPPEAFYAEEPDDRRRGSRTADDPKARRRKSKAPPEQPRAPVMSGAVNGNQGDKKKDKISSWVYSQADEPPEPPPIMPTVIDMPPAAAAEAEAGNGHSISSDEEARRAVRRRARRRAKYGDMPDEEVDDIRSRRREARPMKSSSGSGDYERERGAKSRHAPPSSGGKKSNWFRKLTNL